MKILLMTERRRRKWVSTKRKRPMERWVKLIPMSHLAQGLTHKWSEEVNQRGNKLHCVVS